MCTMWKSLRDMLLCLGWPNMGYRKGKKRKITTLSKAANPYRNRINLRSIYRIKKIGKIPKKYRKLHKPSTNIRR